MAVAQVWKSSKFTIERNQGKTPGTFIFRLSGPFTARDMYGRLSPDALRNTFESEEGDDPHTLHILDLTEGSRVSGLARNRRSQGGDRTVLTSGAKAPPFPVSLWHG
jgi:hypothetical protein